MNRHKKWITTVAALIGLLAVAACLGDIVLQNVLDLKDRPLEETLDEKVRRLLVDPARTPPIIIAGDSRAERQAIPEVFRRELGADTVNVAVSAGELVSTAKTLRQHGVLQSRPLLVISVTSFQVNDGAIDHDAISMDCLMAMRWTDQLLIFRRNLPEMAYRKIQMYKRCLHAGSAGRRTRKKPFAEDGFLGIDSTLDTLNSPVVHMNMQPGRIAHPWYKDLSYRGRKWRVFQVAIEELARSGCRVLLFNGPSSPLWRQVSRNTFVDAAEREYSRLLEREAARYPNVRFVDFHRHWIDEFPDSAFYDIQHLNRTGAAKLSAILCREIKRLDLLEDRPAPVSGPAPTR